MQHQFVKSFLAVLVGCVALFILSAGFDWALEKAGYLKMGPFDYTACLVVAIVMVARCVFSIVAAYLTARLAPNRPMLHAMILGIIGVIGGFSTMVHMWDKSPHWFLIVLTLIPLPFSWAGGDMYARGHRQAMEVS